MACPDETTVYDVVELLKKVPPTLKIACVPAGSDEFLYISPNAWQIVDLDGHHELHLILTPMAKIEPELITD